MDDDISTRERIAQNKNKRYAMALARMHMLLNKREEKQLKEYYIQKTHTAAFLRQLHCTTGNLKDHDGKTRLRKAMYTLYGNREGKSQSINLPIIRKKGTVAWDGKGNEEKAKVDGSRDEISVDENVRGIESRDENSKSEATLPLSLLGAELQTSEDSTSQDENKNENNYSFASAKRNGTQFRRSSEYQRSYRARELVTRKMSLPSQSSTLANDLNAKVRAHQGLAHRRSPSLSFLSNCRNLGKFDLDLERKNTKGDLLIAKPIDTHTIGPAGPRAGIPRKVLLPRLVVTREKTWGDDSTRVGEGSVYPDGDVDRQTRSCAELLPPHQKATQEMKLKCLSASLPNAHRKHSM